MVRPATIEGGNISNGTFDLTDLAVAAAVALSSRPGAVSDEELPSRFHFRWNDGTFTWIGKCFYITVKMDSRSFSFSLSFSCSVSLLFTILDIFWWLAHSFSCSLTLFLSFSSAFAFYLSFTLSLSLNVLPINVMLCDYLPVAISVEPTYCRTTSTCSGRRSTPNRHVLRPHPKIVRHAVTTATLCPSVADRIWYFCRAAESFPNSRHGPIEIPIANRPLRVPVPEPIWCGLYIYGHKMTNFWENDLAVARKNCTGL